MIVARVVNDKSRVFNVRLVRRGDRYGLNDCLVHDKDDPLVEFWDATYELDPRFTLGLGQFVSRYFLGTLTGKDGYSGHDRRVQPRGIALCGHVPEWTVTSGNVVDAIAAVEAALDRCQKSAPGGVT
jgi:hypothetical protein